MINRYALFYYVLTCDKCGAKKNVEETKTAYNAAQAARSIGWSYGRNGAVLCKNCRRPRSPQTAQK